MIVDTQEWLLFFPQKVINIPQIITIYPQLLNISPKIYFHPKRDNFCALSSIVASCIYALFDVKSTRPAGCQILAMLRFWERLFCQYVPKEQKQIIGKNSFRRCYGKKGFNCNLCEFSADKMDLIGRHMVKMHKQAKSYSCKCGYFCKASRDLKRHSLTHTGERPHKCDVCDYAGITSCSLKVHMRSHTGDKPHKCPSCNYACTQAGSMKRHLLIHSGEKPYNCDHCEYTSVEAGHMTRHQLRHNGVKPYNCDHCEYKCAQKGQLRIHIRIHSGERPYGCNKCEYAAITVGNLKKHLFVHSGEKPVKCPKCSQCFTQTGSLKMHMRLHSGQKPFVCSECDYACNQAGSLRVHMLKHSGGRPYHCNQCNLSFAQSGHLRKHKIKHNLVLEKNNVKLEVKFENEDVGEGDPLWPTDQNVELETLALKICKAELELCWVVISIWICLNTNQTQKTSVLILFVGQQIPSPPIKIEFYRIGVNIDE